MTRARGRRWAWALGVLALFVLAFWLTGCDPAVFWARRAHLRDIAAQLFPPDWSYLSAIVAPLLATLRMSVTGTALGVLLALILAPLCAANLPCPAPVRRILRFLVQVLRSFPALILALLATFLFGLGTFSGTVAITLFTLAVMTRMTYEDIETLTLAPYRALAIGAPRFAGWGLAVAEALLDGPREVVIVGDGDPRELASGPLAMAAWAAHAPGLVIVVGNPDGPVPVLAGRTAIGGQPTAYVCRGSSCSLPLTSAASLAAHLAGE